MSKFEFNKLASAVLLAGLITMGTGKLADALYDGGAMPETRGYSIEVAEETPVAAPAAAAAPAAETLVVASAEGAAPVAAATAAVAAAPAPADFASLIASADLNHGKKKAKACKACHTFDNGGKNKVGPNLWNIVGAKAAAVEGFSYSKAMTGKDITWNVDELDAFLKKPKKYLPGTKMAFAGLKKDKDRAAVIAYLQSLK